MKQINRRKRRKACTFKYSSVYIETFKRKNKYMKKTVASKAYLSFKTNNSNLSFDKKRELN